jgi:flagellar motor switch/type III secretory pathway protein FliN
MTAAAAKPALQAVAAIAAAPELAETTGEDEDDARWKRALELPCDLLVDLPLPNFTIADLLKLRPGSVIDADWHVGRDVPLRLNGTLIGWIEFEVIGENLAVRLTELA